MATETKKQQPRKFKAGGVYVTEWSNTSAEGNEYKTYQINRRYKDGDEWKTSDSFKVNDLAKIASAVRKAQDVNVEVIEPEN